MPRLLHLIGVLAVLASGLAAQCLGGSGPCAVLGSGPIHDGNRGPLLAGHVYVVTGLLTVPPSETLTIQPGAILKFINSGALPYDLQVQGRLVANGSPTAPIVFTAYEDDSAGGDTNGDGAGTQPQAGTWKGISVAGFTPSLGQTQLSHCEIRFAGRSGSGCIEALTTALAVTDTTIRDGGGPGIQPSNTAAFTIANCAFLNVPKAIDRLPMAALPTFVGNTAVQTAQDDDRLDVFRTGLNDAVSMAETWSPALTLNQSGVLVMNTTVRIPTGRTLTLSAGMILRWANPLGFRVQGSLIVNGTASQAVVLSELDDDRFGGDLAGDGPSIGAPGAWAGIRLENGSTLQLTHARVAFAGASLAAAVHGFGGTVGITDSIIEQCAQAGVGTTMSTLAITDTDFLGNLRPIDALPLDALPGFTGNTASGHVETDALFVGGGTLQQSLTLGPQNLLGGGVLVLNGSITVGSTATLAITPGFVMKARSGGALRVDGTLDCQGTATNPIIFTSFADDAIGGDTNGDGSATSPSGGDWVGIRLEAGSGSSVLDHVTVAYGGETGSAVEVANAAPTIQRSTIRDARANGLLFGNLGIPSVSQCDFVDNGTTPIGGLTVGRLAFLANNTASGNGSGDVLRLIGGNINAPTTLAPAAALNGSGVFVLTSLVNVRSTGSLTIQPGVILKFLAGVEISVAGTLSIPSGPVTCTSIHDDSIGGDSAGDGPTVGNPGDWSGIALSGSSPSILNGLVIRYAGSSSGGMVRALTGGHVLAGCTLSHGASTGFSRNPGAPVTIQNCHFEGSQVPIEAQAVADLAFLSGNTATGHALGDILLIDEIGIGNPVLAPAAAFNGTGTYHATGSLLVSSGQTLTIQAGVTIKWPGNSEFDVVGTLDTLGTQSTPVVFTGVRDDAFGGDTNGDGSMTTPAPGDWRGLVLSSATSASTFQWTTIKWAGEGGVAAVEILGASPTFDDCTIACSLGAAFDLNGTSAPTINGGSITNNGGTIDGMTWPALGRIRGVAFSGNAGPDATVIDSSFMEGDVEVYPDSYIGHALIVNVSPVIPLGATLTLSEGCIVKAANPGVSFRSWAGFRVRGTPNRPVVLTSIHDDAFGGDTNGNGTLTMPAPGDWGGVESFDLAHARVRFAGQGGGYSVRMGGSAEGLRVEYGAGGGIELTGSLRNCVSFQNAGAGVFVNASFLQGGNPTITATGNLTYCTIMDNGGFGVTGGGNVHVKFTNSWGNALGNYSVTQSARSALSARRYSISFSNGTTLGMCAPIDPSNPLNFNVCVQSGFGNVDVAPLVVDRIGGDLRLQPNSPLRNLIPLLGASLFLDPADYTTLLPAFGAEDGRDFHGNPRVIDDDFFGAAPFQADVGAFERTEVGLRLVGEPVRGTAMSIVPEGPPGVALVAFAIRPDPLPELLLPPAGTLFLGPLENTFQWPLTPVFGTITFPIPDVPALEGIELIFQAAVVENASGFVTLTNTFEGTIR